MKLSKTEQYLIDSARLTTLGISSVTSGIGRKKSGAFYDAGRREQDALDKLVNKGIAEIIGIDKYDEMVGHGNSILWITRTYKISKEV